MDYINLINEVRKRPALWYKTCSRTWNEKIDAWKEVALCLGADTATCKAKWTQLRSNFRKELRETHQKIEHDISIGKYNPKKNYNKGLKLYNHMKFIDGNPEIISNNSKLSNSKVESDTESSDEEVEIEIVIEDSADEKLENYTDEDQGKTCSKQNKSSVSADIQIDAVIEELPDIKIENSPIFDVDTHLRTVNSTITSKNKIQQEQIMLPEAVIKHEIEDESHQNPDMDNVHFEKESNKSTNKENSPKLTSNANSQLRQIDNILIKTELDNSVFQDAGDNIQIKEEFMENEPSSISHAQTVLRENNVDALATNNINDLDFKFLIGYLPQMKCMSKFQNLVFRAKMSDLIMNIIISGEMDDGGNTSALEEKVRNIRSRAIADIKDPNCIFLVSFLPYMKSMHRFQNLEFRAKMNDLMQDVLSK